MKIISILVALTVIYGAVLLAKTGVEHLQTTVAKALEIRAEKQEEKAQ